MITLIEVAYSSHLLVFRFGVYFSYVEGRVEYSSLWCVIITEYKSRKENP